MFASDKSADLAVFGQNTKKDTGLISTFGYMTFQPPQKGSLYKKDIAGDMLTYLPEQFKTQPWRELT